MIYIAIGLIAALMAYNNQFGETEMFSYGYNDLVYAKNKSFKRNFPEPVLTLTDKKFQPTSLEKIYTGTLNNSKCATRFGAIMQINTLPKRSKATVLVLWAKKLPHSKPKRAELLKYREQNNYPYNPKAFTEGSSFFYEDENFLWYRNQASFSDGKVYFNRQEDSEKYDDEDDMKKFCKEMHFGDSEDDLLSAQNIKPGKYKIFAYFNPHKDQYVKRGDCVPCEDMQCNKPSTFDVDPYQMSNNAPGYGKRILWFNNILTGPSGLGAENKIKFTGGKQPPEEVLFSNIIDVEVIEGCP